MKNEAKNGLIRIFEFIGSRNRDSPNYQCLTGAHWISKEYHNSTTPKLPHTKWTFNELSHTHTHTYITSIAIKWIVSLFYFLVPSESFSAPEHNNQKKKKYENDEERNMPLVIYKRSFPLLNYTITLRERFINRLSYWQTVCIGYTLKVIVRWFNHDAIHALPYVAIIIFFHCLYYFRMTKQFRFSLRTTPNHSRDDVIPLLLIISLLL